MRLAPQPSHDAHPNEVTALRRAGAVLWFFPSGLVGLVGFGASDRHMENSLVVLNQTVGLGAQSMCEISHMFAGGKGQWCRRGGIFAFSHHRCLDFLEK